MSPRIVKFFVRFVFFMCVIRLFFRGPFPAMRNLVWWCSLMICLAASVRKFRPLRGISLPTKSMVGLLFMPSWRFNA